MPIKAQGRAPRTATVTDRLDAARRNRKLFVDERNRLLGLLSTVYEAHLFPADRGWPWIICIHLPNGEQLGWHITNEEADSDLFAHLTRLTEGHWDGHRQEDRNQRIVEQIKRNAVC